MADLPPYPHDAFTVCPPLVVSVLAVFGQCFRANNEYPEHVLLVGGNQWWWLVTQILSE